MVKRVWIVLLVVCLLLCGCKGVEPDGNDTSDTPASVTENPVETTKPTEPDPILPEETFGDEFENDPTEDPTDPSGETPTDPAQDTQTTTGHATEPSGTKPTQATEPTEEVTFPTFSDEPIELPDDVWD